MQPQESARQTTKEAPQQGPATEQRIGGNSSEAGSWGRSLALLSHFRIVAWAPLPLVDDLVCAKMECGVLLKLFEAMSLAPGTFDLNIAQYYQPADSRAGS